jgi:iron complex transport system ATP-binding protein
MNIQTGHIVELQNLSVGYKKGRSVISLLEDISLEVYGGELIAVIGRNGSGKSTLLRTLCGLQEPLSGKVRLFNTHIKEYTVSDRARKIAYVSTEIIQTGHMRVKDLVALGRAPHTGWLGKLTIADQTIIMEAMEAVGITEKQNDFINEISDGERQRAMIARSLSQDTELIYLDEPTAFLDIINRFEIYHLLHYLTRDKGKTIIYSTHDLQSAIAESDGLWLIEDKKINRGAPEDMILSGVLATIFDRDQVQFDQQNASFTIKKSYKDSIGLEGKESFEKKWTINALERLGYKIEKNKEKIPSVLIRTSGEKTTWILQKKSGSVELKNIYELSLHLRNLLN